jgi:hypothetical protein
MRHGALKLVILACMGLGLSRPAHADVYNELHGIRSLGMGGANRGLGGSNDALIMNPAAMAMSRRYGVDVLYQYGGADERLNHIHLSAVDSKSGPVAGGIAYSRDWGNPSGTNASLNRIYMGSAMSFGDAFAIGLTGQTLVGSYVNDGVEENHDVYNATLGMALNLSEVLGLGVVWQNIFTTQYDALLPPQVGFGASVRGGSFALATDMVLDMRNNAGRRLSYSVGGEAYLFNMFAARFGWRLAASEPQNLGPDRNYLAAGLEFVTSTLGAGASGEKTLDGPEDWRIIGGIQFFF